MLWRFNEVGNCLEKCRQNLFLTCRKTMNNTKVNYDLLCTVTTARKIKESIKVTEALPTNTDLARILHYDWPTVHKIWLL